MGCKLGKFSESSIINKKLTSRITFVLHWKAEPLGRNSARSRARGEKHAQHSRIQLLKPKKQKCEFHEEQKEYSHQQVFTRIFSVLKT